MQGLPPTCCPGLLWLFRPDKDKQPSPAGQAARLDGPRAGGDLVRKADSTRAVLPPPSFLPVQGHKFLPAGRCPDLRAVPCSPAPPPGAPSTSLLVYVVLSAKAQAGPTSTALPSPWRRLRPLGSYPPSVSQDLASGQTVTVSRTRSPRHATEGQVSGGTEGDCWEAADRSKALCPLLPA